MKVSTWCFSDRTSWIDCILITNLMHWLLFIHKILFSSKCFEPQVLIFRRIHCTHAAYGTVTLYESSWWPVGTQLEWELTLCTDRQPRTLVESYSTICCMYTMYPPEDEHLWLETLWVLTQAVYRLASMNSRREWQYHMLHVCNVSSWRWAFMALNIVSSHSSCVPTGLREIL